MLGRTEKMDKVYAEEHKTYINKPIPEWMTYV